MKLFYKPGACSMASHIALHEIDADFEIDEVDTAAGVTTNGEDFGLVNPKGYVPALRFEDGMVLTEGPAILQHLADSDATQSLTFPAGSRDRAQMLSQLTFVSSELHKAFNPLFTDSTTDAEAEAARAAVGRKFDVVEQELKQGQEFLGAKFTIADAYLFVVSNWANFTGISLSNWPKLQAFVARIAARPAVQRAMKAEGLIA
ncbi:MAG: glutathione transferase GstA [Cognatishimia sp.]|uniref:glutathione transferase GstA n=1 Tax=Cognatishimia sp. TaxID=2211648 RepID=UPI003B8C1133